RVRRLRSHHGGNGLQLARPRPAQRTGPVRPRLPAAGGHLPVLLGRGDCDEFDRGPALPADRPEGACRMTTISPVGPTVEEAQGSVVWARRRTAIAEFWRLFRHDREGMIGLILMALIILVAICAPLLADPSGLSVTEAPGKPIQPPS